MSVRKREEEEGEKKKNKQRRKEFHCGTISYSFRTGKKE